MKEYKIYLLRDPFTLKIRYIGATSTLLGYRLSNHLYYAKIRNSTHLHNWIGSTVKNGGKPLIELIEITDKDNWEEREKYWINYYKKTEDLTNQREGGAGIVVDRTMSSRERSAKAHKVPIVQLTLQGVLVSHFDSVVDASKITKIGKSGITNNLSNRSGSAGGYLWIYLSDYDPKHDYSNNKGKGPSKKCVERENMETGEITVYNSVSEALAANNLLHSVLTLAVRSGSPICIFKFKFL